jgi:hypothetical protein
MADRARVLEDDSLPNATMPQLATPDQSGAPCKAGGANECSPFRSVRPNLAPVSLGGDDVCSFVTDEFALFRGPTVSKCLAHLDHFRVREPSTSRRPQARIYSDRNG